MVRSREENSHGVEVIGDSLVHPTDRESVQNKSNVEFTPSEEGEFGRKGKSDMRSIDVVNPTFVPLAFVWVEQHTFHAADLDVVTHDNRRTAFCKAFDLEPSTSLMLFPTNGSKALTDIEDDPR